MNMEHGVLSDSTFWAFIALIIFIAILAYNKVPFWLARHLDDRAERIEKELEEARRLRQDAQQLLVDYQKRREELSQEAEEIIAKTTREANLLVEEAERKAKEYIDRRNKLAEEKIQQAERDALALIRSKAVDIAFSAANIAIEKNLDEETYNRLFAESLEDVKKTLS